MVTTNSVTSYEVGKEPYKPDESRGKWNSILDFYVACIGHSFGLKNFCLLASIGLINGGVVHVIPLVITVCLISIPMYFLQSTLGQFSSSAFISVFRVAPLFKGIGYVTLILNLTAMTYYSASIGFVMFYWFNSFRSDFPWISCNNTWNTPNCTQNLSTYTSYLRYYDEDKLAASEYIQDLLNGDFAWGVLGCTLLIWTLIGAFVINGIQHIGQIMRYTTGIALVILLILFSRSLFLPGAAAKLGVALKPDFRMLLTPFPWVIAPVVNAAMLGSGWSTVLTLSSYNDFKADNEKYSIMLPFFIFGLSSFSGMLTISVLGHLEHLGGTELYLFQEDIDFPFILFPYYAYKIGAAHLWCLLFYTMILLLEINTIGILMLTILTAIFDEFVITRPYKKPITVGLCAVLFLLSIVYSKGGGFYIFQSLSTFAAFSQMSICFFELIVYVWAYGRERFLRDVQFLLGRQLGQWKFYIIRFVTPALLAICMLFNLVISVIRHDSTLLSSILIFITKILPWLFIPGYAIYKLSTVTGTIPQRFRKSVIPNDWYPIDASIRQEYEAQMGATSHDTSHLVSMDELCDDEEE